MKIGTKVNIILIIVFICGLIISGTALSNVMENKVQKEVTSKALTLMQMANSMRQYTNDRVQPLLLPQVETSKRFIPDFVPSYAVREVFEILRQNKEYNNYIYKDATLNPTNLRDKADEFESQIVKRFRQEPKLSSVSGFRTISGENLFYSAKPFKIEDASCLRCHNVPAEAPKSQLATYGSKNGFGWKLNDIVATQIIYVPAEQIFNAARRSSALLLGVVAVIFTAIIMMMNTLLKKTVLQRIKSIAQVAEQVSVGNMNANFTKQDKDEIGALADAFNRMKYSLEIALKMLNSNQK